MKLFEHQKVRTHWDEKEEKWYFSVIDVILILTERSNLRDYWFKINYIYCAGKLYINLN